MSMLLEVLRLVFACTVSVSVQAGSESCEIGAEIAESLLQTRASPRTKIGPSDVETSTKLPPEIYALGVETFGSKEVLDSVVSSAQVHDIVFAGVNVTLRLAANDNAISRLGRGKEAGEGYGLDDLFDLRENRTHMVNMLDMGGNYGSVTIAAYKKYLGMVRAVTLEPIPATYFFMRWNMWLNNVTYLTQDQFIADPHTPGVVAIHGAVTETDNETLSMCLEPGNTMNAHSASAPEDWDGIKCDCSKMICAKVQGVSPARLLDGLFASGKISLLKMDCEGCEVQALPAIKKEVHRIKRFVGELHLPREDLIDIACQWDDGKYVSKFCKIDESKWMSDLPLGCGVAERHPCKW